MSDTSHSFITKTPLGKPLDGKDLHATDDKNQIAAYFDQRASDWDDHQHPQAEIIQQILDNAEITAGKRILDIACGTGIMFPYYLERGVADITGVDISAGMLDVARSKFADNSSIHLLQADAEKDAIGTGYDVIMIYNAWPHFLEPQKFIDKLSTLLVPGGILAVAHGLGRETLNGVHQRGAKGVSNRLISSTELANMFDQDLLVYKVVDNAHMYQVCGMKN